MSQIEELQQEEQIEVVPGTENTAYEGMSEEAIERAEFNIAVENDPDIEEPSVEPEPIAEEEKVEAKPVVEKPVEEQQQPTGFEWLDELPKEARASAEFFIDQAGQTNARLEQRVRSHLGQLQPAQRAITKLTGELRTAREEQAKMQPKAPDVNDLIRNNDAWVDSEYSEFPEEAAKLKARYRESLDGVSQVLENAEPTFQPTPTVGPDKSQEINHLATAYSDWGERRFSPEFDQWIAGQPVGVAAQLNSAYASDNIQLLDAFTRDNPNWTAPQTPEAFHSLRQAQHSPLFRGWAEGEGINPDLNVGAMPDHQRDLVLSGFRNDLGVVLSEQVKDPKVTKLASRRSAQLQNRDPGSKRQGVRPGQKIDLTTEEGQRAYYKQLVAADPDLR